MLFPFASKISQDVTKYDFDKNSARVDRVLKLLNFSKLTPEVCYRTAESINKNPFLRAKCNLKVTFVYASNYNL